MIIPENLAGLAIQMDHWDEADESGSQKGIFYFYKRGITGMVNQELLVVVVLNTFT